MCYQIKDSKDRMMHDNETLSFDERGVLLGHTVCRDVTTAIMLELVTLNL